jgi:UDP-N-acetylglucosamine diphosphorylase/glucosamine-1-phosphate N-acetyltransferase
MRLCLFEDRHVVDLEPLTLTRPAFELLCGQSSLGVKQCRQFPARSVGVVIRPHLAPWWQTQAPQIPVNNDGWLKSGPTILVNARWLPGRDGVESNHTSCVAVVGDEIAYAVLSQEHLAECTAANLEEHLEHWKTTLPRREAGGRLFRYLWEIVDFNGEQIAADFEDALESVHAADVAIAVVGPRDLLQVHPTAQLDPMIVADTTEGPVVIDEGATVNAFTRLEGPCYIGPRTQVQGAKIRAGTTLGPECRIGGEIEASIVQGFSNKYHDGFLGHAYVGAWVNLGAGTQNSDLRNDYGSVSVTVNGRVVHTGRTKVGCFVGDHTKSGLNTLLNTGTNAGAFCNLLPGGLLPKYVPSFGSWWNGSLSDRADVPALLQTAAKVMRRRGCAFTEAHAELYRTVFEQTADERRQTIYDAETRRLRKSA